MEIDALLKISSDQSSFSFIFFICENTATISEWVKTLHCMYSHVLLICQAESIFFCIRLLSPFEVSDKKTFNKPSLKIAQQAPCVLVRNWCCESGHVGYTNTIMLFSKLRCLKSPRLATYFDNNGNSTGQIWAFGILD